MTDRLSENGLWVPGKTLDHLYPAATPEQLRTEFSDIMGGDAISVDSVLGVVRAPRKDEQVYGVASIDLCEILRETAISLMRTAGNTDYHGNAYADGFWEDFQYQDIEYQNSVIDSTVRVLMEAEGVTPTFGYKYIGAMLRTWREHGVYVIANTSTIEGCEIPTLRFLDKYYGDCIDGIVFPRNHNGLGKTTKAFALERAIETMTNHMDKDPYFALHIDDTSHHVETMAVGVTHRTMHHFMPRFETNVHLEGREKITHADSPVEVFGAANEYVLGQLELSGNPSDELQRARSIANAALLRTLMFSRKNTTK